MDDCCLQSRQWEPCLNGAALLWECKPSAPACQYAQTRWALVLQRRCPSLVSKHTPPAFLTTGLQSSPQDSTHSMCSTKYALLNMQHTTQAGLCFGTHQISTPATLCSMQESVQTTMSMCMHQPLEPRTALRNSTPQP